LSNSELKVLDAIKKITGIKPEFFETDLTNKLDLFEILGEAKKPFDAIIHFAAHKSVGESVNNPLKYYANNIVSLINILEGMVRFKVSNLVFSSSSTVYGQPDILPVTEDTSFGSAQSPYGNTKQICENIIRDLCRAESKISVVSLRYFNPAGADDSGLIGELPKGTPNNLVPFITQTAAGIRPVLNVYGNDYNTPDGTAIRDYIHVTDLAKAHIAALNRIAEKGNRSGFEFYNVATGKGLSVSEIINCFESVNNVKVPFKITDRRKGDVECIFADTSRANHDLKWKAEKTIEEMMRSAWKWQLNLMDETINKFVVNKKTSLDRLVIFIFAISLSIH
jgi:UDP-glucose 4-epimerase